MEWISVKDKLPDCDTDVLVFAKEPEKYISIGFIPSGENYFIRLDDKAFFNVTHWQPLPNPPEVNA